VTRLGAKSFRLFAELYLPQTDKKATPNLETLVSVSEMKVLQMMYEMQLQKYSKRHVEPADER